MPSCNRVIARPVKLGSHNWSHILELDLWYLNSTDDYF